MIIASSDDILRRVRKYGCRFPMATVASASLVMLAANSSLTHMVPSASSIKRNKTAMCAIVLNEELYLDEFVDYHHALGFDKFFIYDNSEGYEMKQWGKLKGDHVDVIPFPGEKKQMPAYIECEKTVAATGMFAFAAFFDVDEFLVLKKHNHVSDMLEEHCHKGALVVNWLFFDSNGWNLQGREPVTRRFTYRQNATNQHVKTIARIDDIKSMKKGDPHNFVELKGGLVHDSTGQVVSGPFNVNGPTDVAVLHHYHQKSVKEYLQKRMRGRATTDRSHPSVKTLVELATQQLTDALAGERIPLVDDGASKEQGLIFDDSAWQFLKENVPGYALYDKIALMSAHN